MDNGQNVGPDEVGEIVVRSRFLSPGYWRNDALTAQRFSDDPSGHGLRRFHSGDFGCRDADGALIFMDRKDNRIKINGYRIEISEVEDTLNGLAEVQQALVCARNEETEPSLVAYVIPRAGDAPEEENND